MIRSARGGVGMAEQGIVPKIYQARRYRGVISAGAMQSLQLRKRLGRGGRTWMMGIEEMGNR